MANYNANKKSTGLDILTSLAGTALLIVGDPSDSGKAKAITKDNAISDVGLTMGNTTANDVSTSRHGFCPTLPNDATKYLDGTGNYSVPSMGASITSINGNGNAAQTIAAGSGINVSSSGGTTTISLAGGVATTSKNGAFTYGGASGTQTVTHGLGVIPAFITLFANIGSGNFAGFVIGSSQGHWDSGGQSCSYAKINNPNAQSGHSTSTAIEANGTNGSGSFGAYSGFITNVTTTTFDIVWSVSGTALGVEVAWKVNS